jgi:hypothetical protein
MHSYVDKNFILVKSGCYVIISDKLSNDDTQRLVGTLEKYQLVIGYSLKDLKGISLSLCTHRIPMEQDHKPVREHR